MSSRTSALVITGAVIWVVLGIKLGYLMPVLSVIRALILQVC